MTVSVQSALEGIRLIGRGCAVHPAERRPGARQLDVVHQDIRAVQVFADRRQIFLIVDVHDVVVENGEGHLVASAAQRDHHGESRLIRDVSFDRDQTRIGNRNAPDFFFQAVNDLPVGGKFEAFDLHGSIARLIVQLGVRIGDVNRVIGFGFFKSGIPQFGEIPFGDIPDAVVPFRIRRRRTQLGERFQISALFVRHLRGADDCVHARRERIAVDESADDVAVAVEYFIGAAADKAAAVRRSGILAFCRTGIDAVADDIFAVRRADDAAGGLRGVVGGHVHVDEAVFDRSPQGAGKRAADDGHDAAVAAHELEVLHDAFGSDAPEEARVPAGGRHVEIGNGIAVAVERALVAVVDIVGADAVSDGLEVLRQNDVRGEFVIVIQDVRRPRKAHQLFRRGDLLHRLVGHGDGGGIGAERILFRLNVDGKRRLVVDFGSDGHDARFGIDADALHLFFETERDFGACGLGGIRHGERPLVLIRVIHFGHGRRIGDRGIGIIGQFGLFEIRIFQKRIGAVFDKPDIGIPALIRRGVLQLQLAEEFGISGHSLRLRLADDRRHRAPQPEGFGEHRFDVVIDRTDKAGIAARADDVADGQAVDDLGSVGAVPRRRIQRTAPLRSVRLRDVHVDEKIFDRAEHIAGNRAAAAARARQRAVKGEVAHLAFGSDAPEEPGVPARVFIIEIADGISLAVEGAGIAVDDGTVVGVTHELIPIPRQGDIVGQAIEVVEICRRSGCVHPKRAQFLFGGNGTVHFVYDRELLFVRQRDPVHFRRRHGEEGLLVVDHGIDGHGAVRREFHPFHFLFEGNGHGRPLGADVIEDLIGSRSVGDVDEQRTVGDRHPGNGRRIVYDKALFPRDRRIRGSRHHDGERGFVYGVLRDHDALAVHGNARIRLFEGYGVVLVGFGGLHFGGDFVRAGGQRDAARRDGYGRGRGFIRTGRRASRDREERRQHREQQHEHALFRLA